MVHLFNSAPNPYLFKGGTALDYEVFVGEAGTWCTRHRASGQVIQSFQPTGLGTNMLPIANLCLGVLNLGMEIYNTHKLHQVQSNLEQQRQEINAGFTNIHLALSAQHRILEILVSNQSNVSHQMDILRREIQFGFEKVIEEVRDVEARRFREEFETRTFKLLKSYERFGELLPDFQKADTSLERAEELEAWLRFQLSKIQPAQPQRLPLLVVLAFCIRAKADTFEAKGGSYTSLAKKELIALKQRIQDEAFSFCEGRGLYN